MADDITDAAADVIERVALANSSDGATDDLTVALAIELAEARIAINRITAERNRYKAALDLITSIEGSGEYSEQLLDTIQIMRETARAALATSSDTDARDPVSGLHLCSDCPPAGANDPTRCRVCPRNTSAETDADRGSVG